MKLLIDTHVFIWLATSDTRLSTRATDMLLDPANAVMISVVSRWEIVLKQRSTDFRLPVPFDFLVQRSGFMPLNLEFGVPAIAETLPDIHADPFDRMLVAQALASELTLVTADKTVRRYPVSTLW